VKDCKVRRHLAGFMLASCLLVTGNLWAQTVNDNTTATTKARGQTLSPDVPAIASEEGRSEGSPKSFWETVPPITPYPPPGNFFVPPSGPGYYTLLDLWRDHWLEDRPHNPYLKWSQSANPFFNVDFRYLDNPDNTEVHILDPLKRIHIGDDWLLSFGGELRERYNNFDNAYLFNKGPAAGSTDTFNLFRTRLYEDLWYRDNFRIYAEFTTADSSPQTVSHGFFDIDKADILNLFGEIKLLELDDRGVYVRGGRQELLFGSQRLISPGDWSNELRTFQGVRGLWHRDDLDVDAFWVQPVVINTGKFDSVDDKQQFFGNWWTFHLDKDASIDAYYLLLDNNNPGVARGQYKANGGFDVNTFGARYVCRADRFLWDFEGAVQVGEWVNQNMIAGMSATGVGWYFKNLPATPTIWVYYDFASGDPHPGIGHIHSTFDQLFPYPHAYFDCLDVIGRQNIDDPHVDLAFFPAPWARVTFGYYYFTLDSARDALYNPAGGVVRSDTTGKAGTDVGNAINASIQFQLDYYQMVNVSYGRLFSGPFIEKTAVTPNAAKDLSELWVTYSFKW
jgi:hypothetical protein